MSYSMSFFNLTYLSISSMSKKMTSILTDAKSEFILYDSKNIKTISWVYKEALKNNHSSLRGLFWEKTLNRIK